MLLPPNNYAFTTAHQKPCSCGHTKALLFNIYSQLFGCYSKKKSLCERSSTLPPRGRYSFDNQGVGHGGIMAKLWVELHVIPPIFHS